MEKAFRVCPEGSLQSKMLKIDMAVDRGEMVEEIIRMRKELILGGELDLHEMAVQYSKLASDYIRTGDMASYIHYSALSAQYDIFSSTHETTAAKSLAQQMYSEGDMKRASLYAFQALHDATEGNFYLRFIELNDILHTIEDNRFSRQYYRTLVFLLFALFLLIILTVCSITLRKLHIKNKRIHTANENLAQLLASIQESEIVKSNYILHTLKENSYTEFINLVETKSQQAISKINIGKIDDAKTILHNLGVKDARKDSYANFDDAFTRLFPDFLDRFNAVFHEENRFHLDKRGLLPMEVRIFALIRLGIDDMSKIAEYLSLSVNTV